MYYSHRRMSLLIYLPNDRRRGLTNALICIPCFPKCLLLLTFWARHFIICLIQENYVNINFFMASIYHKVFKHDLYFCICALNFWMTRSKVNGERREHSIRCLYLPHLLKKHGLIACKLSSSKTWNSFESCSDLNDVGKSCSIEVTWILYSILECFYFLATIWAQVDVLFFN